MNSKNSMLAIAMFCALSSGINTLAAESETRTQVNEYTSSTGSGDIAQGFSISLVKDFMDAKINVSGTQASEAENADHKYGIAFGSSHIANQQLGGMGRLIYTAYDGGEGEDVKLLRLDGNATYGMSSTVYLYGGLNISRVTNISSDDPYLKIDINPGVGFQLGVGAQFNKNMGVQIGFARLNNKVEISAPDFGLSADAELIIEGLEVALVGTF